MQDLEHNKQVIRDTWERVLPSGDLDDLDALVAPDVVQRGQRPGEAPGLDGLKATMRWLSSVFSDQRWEIHDLVAEGDLVVCRLTHHGRHTGDLMGIPPTGRTVAYQYVHFFRFEGGKVVEQWSVRDDMALMRQLGVIPEQGKAA
jgi:steroid delta-isomerase-like uncharacterized protein